MSEIKRNILIAGTIFVVAILVALFFTQSSGSFLSGNNLKILGTILAIAFLINGVYGIFSRRVYGRSFEKYWGGWVYREENPFFYWLYVFMWFFVAIVLFFSCASIFF